jgi:hypothetical protein
LPDTLVGLGIKGARFEQEDLIIKFGWLNHKFSYNLKQNFCSKK